LTFAVCGFAIVIVLGSRSFCSYGCPYGAVFRGVDRLAPGSIRLGDGCERCGACTAACTSNVRVHEELNRYGMVVDAACLKDLDCVAICPKQAVHFGFGRPALFKTKISSMRVRKRYDFSLGEELGMAIVLLATIVIYRGLYDAVPFLMSIGLGVIAAYLCVVAVRMRRRSVVDLYRWRLRSVDRVLPEGRVFVGMMLVFSLLTLHSATIRYHEIRGTRS
jgi:polyferredoxin